MCDRAPTPPGVPESPVPDSFAVRHATPDAGGSPTTTGTRSRPPSAPPDRLLPPSHRDSHRLEHRATRALGLAPQQEPLPILLHIRHLQTIQVTDHIGPLQHVTPLLQPSLQLLTEHQRQERAEHVSPDRLVTLVEDRPGL